MARTGRLLRAARMTGCPFLCRCPVCKQSDPVPWHLREATAAELAAHIRLRYAMEQLQKEARRERSQ